MPFLLRTIWRDAPESKMILEGTTGCADLAGIAITRPLSSTNPPLPPPPRLRSVLLDARVESDDKEDVDPQEVDLEDVEGIPLALELLLDPAGGLTLNATSHEGTGPGPSSSMATKP